MEEVEDQPDAVIGKFLVKSFTALVLFDTGASHSYISREFGDKFKLPTLASELTRCRVYGQPMVRSDTLNHW